LRIVVKEMERVPEVSSVVTGAQRGTPAPLPASAQRAINFALLLSALRCTVQYIVLPFVLPWIGVATSIPPWVTLILGALALASLARNVRTLWRTRHARRWSYLFTALAVAAALLLFTVVDVRALLHA
jgi:ABC-type iron transport system FetAB permease component